MYELSAPLDNFGSALRRREILLKKQNHHSFVVHIPISLILALSENESNFKTEINLINFVRFSYILIFQLFQKCYLI